MQQQEITPEHLEVIKAGIKKISDFNVFSVRDIILHFQTLTSARASRMLMEAPGLYYRDLSFYVLSKSGMNRGHASMNENIQPLLPEGKGTCYGFVLYPESFVRTCMDKIFRKTTKNITPDMRVSMENVFNRKNHRKQKLNDSETEKELILMLKKDLGRRR
jgi:hypothetical protein